VTGAMADEPGYAIYEYSRRGNLADLRDSLQQGAGPDKYMAYDGSTALIMAARQGHGHIVRELLAHNASPHVRTDEGSTVLSHAVSGGSVEAVLAVLAAGVAVDEANEDGVTPLILAATYGLAQVVETLLDAGADMNAEADGWGTALDSATGAAADLLRGKGAVTSAAGRGQPLAKGAERFEYGCDFNQDLFEVAAPAARTARGSAVTACKTRAGLGDSVRLARPKPGLLKDGDVGKVIDDDGSDCIPLKVKLGDAHDFYDYADVVTIENVVELPPDSDRATSEGTSRRLGAKLDAAVPSSALGSTGLRISPVGFGCHRLGSSDLEQEALSTAIKLGCNLIDLAPNYTDGVAETSAGLVLQDLLSQGEVRRDELVVVTKVGNVVGKQMQYAQEGGGVPGLAQCSDTLWHCMSPAWIEQELTRSLERLRLKCVDCVLLHCPECETKAVGITMPEVYKRLGEAFRHLEGEVARGRIAMYGVSAAFHPLRPTDSEHLDLNAVLGQLPPEHHFRVLQFPLNYAEAQLNWVGHVSRKPDGSAIDAGTAATAPTFFELTKKHALATLTNRPLDGIYRESHGVLRFSSLDCDVRSFSEMQLDECDALEAKLNSICGFCQEPYCFPEGDSGQLAAKTVKVLSSLDGVDCVLLGMRKLEYVLGTLPLCFGRPPLPADVAAKGLKSLHNTVEMWFATASHEADHGTAKEWRLPVADKYDEQIVGA
jgi:aryl-alcohol dehydrogenase-like predicted oxidoreductase